MQGYEQDRHLEKEDTAKRILEQSHRLFQEHGYAGVSTRAIREAAQVSTPSLYHHFHSKEELFAQVCLQLEESLGAQIRSAIGRSTQLQARLQGVAEAIWSAGTSQSMVVDAMRHLPEERRAPLGQAAIRHFLAPVVGLMTEAMAANDLPAGDPWRLAQAFLALVDGYAMGYARGDPLPPPHENHYPVELFLAGARAGRTT
jgi:AcrR family transcriptional regulator